MTALFPFPRLLPRAGRLPTAPGLVLVGLYGAAFWAMLIAKPWSQTVLIRIDDGADVVATMVAVGLCVGAFWRRQSDLSDRPTWRGSNTAALLLGAGLLFYALGSAVWYIYQVVLKQPPFPSWADLFYLWEDPLLLCGILMLPLRSMTGVGRTRLAFDGLTTMTAVVTLSWYFVLGPTIQQGGESLLAKLVGTAYPLSDLVLILCLVLLWSRHFEARLRPTILPISLALAMIIVADTIFDYQGLHGGAPSPSMVDPMWSLAALLIGLGAWSLRRLGAARPMAEEGTEFRALSRPSLAHSLLPYSLVPITAALVLYVLIVPSKPGLDGGVYVGGVALFGLVVVRQILALVENARLFDRAAAANSALEDANAALADANATLTELATTDPITSVLNHRALVEGLEREVARSSRYGHDCSVLFLDLDHFKAINDTYGHMAGDDALRTFAELVKSHLRGSDVIGRWGGEEFVVVLVETDISAAMEAAERIRNALAQQHLNMPDGIPMTCSIGVASYPDDGCTTNELVSAADHGVYGAKMLGRNRCFRARDTTSASISQMSAPPGHA